MSNQLVYDPLLVRYLADELDTLLRGRACAAAPVVDGPLTLALPLDRGEALRFDLHPRRGWIRRVPWDSDPDDLDSACEGVEAPADERILRIRLRAPDRFRASARTLVVELATNQWNALLVSDTEARILMAARPRRAGARALYPGAAYQPPPPAGRYGVGAVDAAEAWARWESSVGALAPGEREDALLRGFAYTGRPNVAAILGAAAREAVEEPLREAFSRWWELRSLPHPEPRILELDGRRLPYPVPLPGTAGEPVGSLLEGMDRVAGELPETAEATEEDALRRGAAARVEALERKARRLEEQLEAAGEGERYRSWGDLLLARLHEVPRGAERVVLSDWEGGSVSIELDPTLTPAENAARWYDEARRRARADARIPGLLEETRAELARWRAVAAGGEVPGWAAAALRRGEGPASTEEGTSRPYRSYRTSGGLEVRVGRSAKENDRLTFGNSSPNDVWLHAQSVPGSHVVLRWSEADAPPARDLEQAATLAALFSKARSSSLVAVDWTRRKYVRKPRGAPPGSVVLQRAKTLFVQPDPAVEEALRGD